MSFIQIRSFPDSRKTAEGALTPHARLHSTSPPRRLGSGCRRRGRLAADRRRPAFYVRVVAADARHRAKASAPADFPGGRAARRAVRRDFLVKVRFTPAARPARHALWRGKRGRAQRNASWMPRRPAGVSGADATPAFPPERAWLGAATPSKPYILSVCTWSQSGSSPLPHCHWC